MLYDILVFVENAVSTSIPGGVAESVDAADLKSVSRKRVRVQVSPSPSKIAIALLAFTQIKIYITSYLSKASLFTAIADSTTIPINHNIF